MKAFMSYICKKEKYTVTTKNINEMNSNCVNSNSIHYDNPAFVGCGNEEIFTITPKPRNDSQTESLKHILTQRRASRRLSIIQRAGDGNVKDNPLRRKMSFIKDTSGVDEPLRTTIIQILLASLCAGFGNVGAGVILDIIQKWAVFVDIKEMFILIPSLLGLKGNLEMTMASRLSTEANLGHMDKWSTTIKMIGGDMALVQCQATIVSFLAAVVAILVSVCQSGHIAIDDCLVICSSALVTANVACFLLGLIMAFVIVFSNKVDIDPDNIATPIAASLGDISTAALFAFFAQWIHSNTRNRTTTVPVVATVWIIVFALLLPVFYIIARKNFFTHNLVHSGWTPVISAMLISSGGGLFLDSAVERYDKLPPFQPVICGVGGNMVAVAASKISTSLHMHCEVGKLPDSVKRFSLPYKVFWNNKDKNTKLALTLLLMTVPLHLLYSVIIWVIQRDRITLTAPLILLYISFAATQVFILLFICYNLVHILWSFSINPDMSSIPILTSLGDLLGSAFLLLVFIILQKINDPNAIISDSILNNSNVTDIYTTTHILNVFNVSQ